MFDAEPKSQIGRVPAATPGELMLSPIALLAMAGLVVNDVWIKHHWPGLVSGKLSDFTGLVVFPLALCSLVEFVRRLRHKPIACTADAGAWTVICGLGFAWVKLTYSGQHSYAWTIGAIRWAFHSAFQPGVHKLVPIDVTRDPTDLVALVVLPVTYVLISRRASRG